MENYPKFWTDTFLIFPSPQMDVEVEGCRSSWANQFNFAPSKESQRWFKLCKLFNWDRKFCKFTRFHIPIYILIRFVGWLQFWGWSSKRYRNIFNKSKPPFQSSCPSGFSPLQVLGLVEDAHPDALASRCLVTLAILRSGCPLPWDHRQEFAWYV